MNFSFPLVCHDLNRRSNDTLSQIPTCQDPLSLTSLVGFKRKSQTFQSPNEDSGARPCSESLLAQREGDSTQLTFLLHRHPGGKSFFSSHYAKHSTTLLPTSVCSFPVKWLRAPPLKHVFALLKYPWVTCFLKSCSMSIDNTVTLIKYPEQLFAFSLDKTYA